MFSVTHHFRHSFEATCTKKVLFHLHISFIHNQFLKCAGLTLLICIVHI